MGNRQFKIQPNLIVNSSLRPCASASLREMPLREMFVKESPVNITLSNSSELYRNSLAMKKLYTTTIALSTLFLFNSCTKDYTERIIGTWELTDVDRNGWGGSTSNLPFRDGKFEFNEGGGMVYTNSSGAIYKGSWDIREERTYDANGNTRYVRSLEITAINFTTQEVRTEFFNEMQFRSNDKFKAYVYSGSNTYVFRFER